MQRSDARRCGAVLSYLQRQWRARGHSHALLTALSAARSYSRPAVFSATGLGASNKLRGARTNLLQASGLYTMCVTGSGM